MPRKSLNFVLLVLLVLLVGPGYCLNIDKIKVYFLNGDYKAAIQEGERVLADYRTPPSDLDELYYILGLAYLKDGNYLRASDIFEITIGEFRSSVFKDQARLGLGDTYFLRGNYAEAEKRYEELLRSSPVTKLTAPLYYRLSQTAFKMGDTQRGKEYLDKLQSGFPLNPEARLSADLSPLSDIYYAVQVGAFSKPANARNLCAKLVNKGYDAYIEETEASNSIRIYRLKVGHLKSRPEAIALEKRLSAEGYPTKIIP